MAGYTIRRWNDEIRQQGPALVFKDCTSMPTSIVREQPMAALPAGVADGSEWITIVPVQSLQVGTYKECPLAGVCDSVWPQILY